MSRNITVDHLHPSLTPPQGERAIVRCGLRHLVQQPTLCPPGQLKLPTLFVFKAASLTKPHAIEQLQTDLIGYLVDVAVVSKTHFKKKHSSEILNIAGYALLRLDRPNRRAGCVAIYLRHQLTPTDSVGIPVVKTAHTYELLWIKLDAYKPPIFIGSIYHPPKPIYNTNSFVDYLEATIDVINSTFPSSLIILAGDLNQLSNNLILESTGLIFIVKDPTRGDNNLDRIYISIDSYQQTKINNHLSKATTWLY